MPRLVALAKTKYESGLLVGYRVSEEWLDEVEFFEDQRRATRHDIESAEARSLKDKAI